MKRFSSLLSILTISLILSIVGCSQISVKTNFDNEADFGALKTYEWKEADSNAPKYAIVKNSLVSKRVHRAVDKELSAKGYSKSGNPDFYVVFHAIAKEKVEVEDYGYTYGRWYRGYYNRDYDLRYHLEGTLILDVVDAQNNQLIWRGIGTTDVDPESAEEKINQVAAQILGKFPPK